MNDQQKKVFFQWWNENWKSVFVVFAIIITLILAFVKFPWAPYSISGPGRDHLPQPSPRQGSETGTHLGRLQNRS